MIRAGLRYKNILLTTLAFCTISILTVYGLELGKGNHVKDPVPGQDKEGNPFKYYCGWPGEERPDRTTPHQGLDVVGKEGGLIYNQDVYPVRDGKVIYSRTMNGYGNIVIIDHGTIGDKGYLTFYAHLKEIAPDIKEGKEVNRKDDNLKESTKIGKVGDSGCEKYHYHLHYEVQTYDPSNPPKDYTELNISGVNNPKSKWEKEIGDLGPEGENYIKRKGEKEQEEEDDSMDDEKKEDGEDDEPPGKDNPDDNESSSTGNPSSLSSDSKNRFYRLAPKKGKKYILQLWNLEKLLEERDQYFESLGTGGTVDEAYLNSLNTKIDESYNLISTHSLQYDKERSETPDVVILKNGYFVSASSLINKSSEAWKRVIPSFSPLWVKENPVMVIPTGALYGMENSGIFKAVLEEYARNGGTIIAFTQQHGYEFSVLPTPDEVPIIAYGWREDQSCHFESMYVDTWHPALSSITESLVSSPIDGFFADYPSNSTVILSRKVNAMPAMLAYPCGEGWVVVTSAYEDWACTHWQSTTQGRAIVRDLITWAKNPDLEISEYNLRDNPDPEVTLNLEIKNISNEAGSGLKILWLDPDRNLYFEEEKLVSIPAGEEMTLPLSV